MDGLFNSHQHIPFGGITMKLNHSRVCALAGLLLALPFGVLAQDVIVMKNGDVITGDVTKVTADEVRIDPSYADEFGVNRAEVESINLDNSFQVKLDDDTTVDAQIALDESGEQVLIVDGQARPVALADVAEAKEPDPYMEWGAKVDFNATRNDGNTDSQNTLLFSSGNLRLGDHRHLADLTFRREETDGVRTKEQDLFNYSYNWMFSKPWYMGGSFTFERDPIRDLDHRYTAGLLFGRDIFNEEGRFLTITIGAGYSDEEIAGVSDSGAVGLWTLRYEQTFWEGVDFFHNHQLTQHFYGEDNLIFKTNTGFRFDLVSDLYATVSLRYDYETEPAAGASKDDSTLALGLGYSF